ncbi:MAG: hypothetical protein H6738_00440 [Alphaproteobacteria bacterium]|nr:hypothetical protein [Alphaproteobacteria bacterium]MCB9695235.1 hypothetical protein [Alphaproteobacteria bacterium]
MSPLLLLACVHPTPPAAGGCEEPPTPEPFDATAAWDELEEALREVYAYLEREDLDVEGLLARTRERATAAPDAASFRAIALHATYAFTDPHLLVGPLTDDDANVWPTSGDLALTWDEGHLVVVDVRSDSSAAAAGIRPGAELVTADGQPARDRIEALWDGLVPDPSPAQWAYAATVVANGRRTGTRTLGWGDGSTTVLDNPRDLARAVSERPPLDKRVVDGVCVIRFHNSLGRDETIGAFDEAVTGCDGVVIDLRNTPSGGNTDVARAIIGHFVDEPRPYQVHEIPAVERQTTVPRHFVEYAFPRAPRIPGRLAVLGGRWTGSMGEGLVIGLQAAAGARTFGTGLADLLGALYTFELERSDAVLELGGEALFRVDGLPREDFVPDVVFEAGEPLGGADPVEEAALAWVRTPPSAPR